MVLPRGKGNEARIEDLQANGGDARELSTAMTGEARALSKGSAPFDTAGPVGCGSSHIGRVGTTVSR
jgi:hypothetical protein